MEGQQGVADWREQEHTCLWCYEKVHVDAEYSSELTCGHRHCGRNIYHQSCLEDHLKKQGLPSDRLAGFCCPRGLGKKAPEGTVPCPGRINATHKHYPCNNKKKKAKAAVQSAAQPKAPPQKVQKPAAAVQAPARPQPLVEKRAATLAAAVGQANDRKALELQVANIRAQMKNPATKIQNEAQPAAAAARGGGGSGGSNGAGGWVPGMAAAERLTAGQQASFIPGLEFADTKPQPKSKKAFNLADELAAFPSLAGGGGGGKSSTHTAAAAAGADREKALSPSAGSKSDGGSSSAGGHGKKSALEAPARINALDPTHSKGFISDLDRYNQLLGQMGLTDDLADDGDYSNGDHAATLHSPIPPPFPAAAPPDHAAPVEPMPDADAAIDPSSISDELLMYAITYGTEAAGLPASLDSFVQDVKRLLNQQQEQQQQLLSPVSDGGGSSGYWQSSHDTGDEDQGASKSRTDSPRDNPDSPYPYLPVATAAKATPVVAAPVMFAPAQHAYQPIPTQQPSHAYHPLHLPAAPAAHPAQAAAVVSTVPLPTSPAPALPPAQFVQPVQVQPATWPSQQVLHTALPVASKWPEPAKQQGSVPEAADDDVDVDDLLALCLG